MGVSIPGVTGLLNQPTSQIINGSLNFEGGNNQALKRTPTTAGNRRTWTYSCWVKKQNDNRSTFFSAGTTSSDTGFTDFGLGTQKRLRFSGWNTNWRTSFERIRDYNQFYHFVVAFDATQSTAADKVKLYKNGVQITDFNSYNEPSNVVYAVNDTVIHYIGGIDGGGGENLTFTDFSMTQVYFIDGQQLGPEEFGFTDPLTNTWRPKKYTGDFNVASSDYTGVFAPYSTSARFNSFKTYTNVNENATSYTLPMGNPSHYGGKALDLASGGFQVQTNNSADGDFFMAIWVNLDAYETGKQFGVDIAGNYVYFETVSNGAVKIRHNGSGGNTSNSGYANDTNQWQHWALSRSGGSLRAFVDGEEIVTDTGGISGDNTVLENSKFNFFGADNNTTSYNINGQVIDAVIYIGQGVSGNFTPPTSPLIDSSGNINHYSEFSDSQLYFASPLVDVSGSSPNSLTDYIQTGVNSFYLPFDGNSPIGQDKSGNGNDWTPVNFSGSNTIDKATGALPILNTVSGGRVATVGVRTDATVAAGVGTCVLAVPMAGPMPGNYTDVSNQIDSRSSVKTVTADDNADFSTDTSIFYSGSFKFDGTSDKVSILDHDELDGFGDFTIEMWWYCSTLNSGEYLLAKGNSYMPYMIYNSGSDVLQFFASSNNTSWDIASGASFGSSIPMLNKWNHIAVTREGSTGRLFLNGVQTDTFTSSLPLMTSGDNITVFADSTGGAAPIGYAQDLRIYDGVAKYTEDFIPASTSPDILPDTPSGVSGSSKLTKITEGAVTFDGNGDYLLASKSSDFAYGTGDFTTEAYVYLRSTPSANIGIIDQRDEGEGTATKHTLLITTGNAVKTYVDGSNQIITSAVVRPKTWHHIAYSRSGTTGRIFVDGILQASGTDSKDYSANARVAIGHHPTVSSREFPGSISNLRIVKGTALYTSNFTPPTRELTNVTNTKLLCCQSNKSAGAADVSPSVSGSINDGTVWSDLVKGNLDTQYGNSNRAFPFNGGDKSSITYVDGIRPPAGNLLTMDFGTRFNSATKLKIYAQTSLDGNTYAGTNENLEINGVALTASEWSDNGGGGAGSTDPATFTLSSGLQTLAWGYDYGSTSSGYVYLAGIEVDDVLLVNPVTPMGYGTIISNVSYGRKGATNFNPFITDINTVRGQETGYATWNPLKMGTSDVSMSEGNLFWGTTSNGPDRCTYSTIGMDSGKFYWENEIVEATATAVGIANALADDDGGPALAHNWMYYSATGQVYLDGSASSYGAAYNTNGTIIGVAFDRDNLTLEFYKNGVSQGKLTSISGLTDSETYFAMCGDSGGASQSQVRVNFGQKPFKFPPPDGFQPLNFANVRPSTVITRPDQYVGVTTYTGTGDAVSPRTVELSIAADLVWAKSRDRSSSHQLVDTVRGDNKVLIPNSTDQERDPTSYFGGGGVASIDGRIISIESGSTNNANLNTDGEDAVVWHWKAGGNKNTFNVDDVGHASAAAAGLTAGDVTPTGSSVGTKQGFSIIRWTAPTWNGGPQQVPHGLTQSPSFIITKVIDDIASWYCYHKDLDPTNPEDYYITLNNDQNRNTLANGWGTNPPDNTTFGDRQLGWGDGKDVIAYIWHDVPGLQKFGTYIGNGDNNGPFVELGFRPAVIWVKNRQSGSTNWVVFTDVIDDMNPAYKRLEQNKSLTENTDTTTNAKFDILSNGFKSRGGNGTFVNTLDDKYIYCAWAKSPRINLYGGQANAF